MTTVHGSGVEVRAESIASNLESSLPFVGCSLHYSIAESEIVTSFIVVCSLFVGSDGHLSSVASNLGLAILSQLARLSASRR